MPRESTFKAAGKGIHTHKNSEVAEGSITRINLLGNSFCHAVGFFCTGVKSYLSNRRATFFHRNQRLRLALCIMANEPICSAENWLGTTIIFGKGKNGSVGEIPFKVKNVADIRTAELIDRLIWIAHHAKIRIIHRKTTRNRILRSVGILIFIHHHIAIAGIKLGSQLGIIAKGEGGPIKQIIKIEGVTFSQSFFVVGINLGNRLTEKILGTLSIFLGAQKLILCFADGIRDRIGGESFCV